MYKNGILEIQNNKITYVGSADAYTLPGHAQVVDAANKHIYPGLIALNSNIGLNEIDYVRATNDYFETGHLNPHVRSTIAYNTDSDVIPTVRSNGVLMAQITPRGSLLAGKSSLMYLNGLNAQQSLVVPEAGMHIYWPAFHPNSEADKNKFLAERHQMLLKLEQLFTDANYYKKHPTAHSPHNTKLQALQKALNQEIPFFFHADFEAEVLEIIAFAEKFNLKHPVIVGAKEAVSIADILADKKIPVVLNRVHDTPTHAQDAVESAFSLPYLYHQKGVKVALTYQGDMEFAYVRNLPFAAGTAAAYGVDKETALAMVSLHPAQILKADGTLGSLQVGKYANFIISEGDLLDYATSNITHIYIQGKPVSVANKHTLLYEFYKNQKP